MSTNGKFYTGVGLDLEVVEFLTQLGHETQRPRSWLINAIIREKARSLAEERAMAADEASRREPPIINI